MPTTFLAGWRGSLRKVLNPLSVRSIFPCQPYSRQRHGQVGRCFEALAHLAEGGRRFSYFQREGQLVAGRSIGSIESSPTWQQQAR